MLITEIDLPMDEEKLGHLKDILDQMVQAWHDLEQGIPLEEIEKILKELPWHNTVDTSQTPFRQLRDLTSR